MNNITVIVVERPDEHTIICRVRWSDPKSGSLSIHVCVPATVSEYHMPSDEKVAPRLSSELENLAISSAQKLAATFANSKS